MFSETDTTSLRLEKQSDGADGPDAVAEILGESGERVMPMYANSPDGSASYEVRDADGTWHAMGSGGTTPSLTLNPTFGALPDGSEPTGLRVTNSSGAAADDSAFVRAFVMGVE